jgi:hypothetical protein
MIYEEIHGQIHDQIEKFLIEKGFQRFESGEPYGEIYIRDKCVIFLNLIGEAHPETIRNIKERHERLIFFKKNKEKDKILKIQQIATN